MNGQNLEVGGKIRRLRRERAITQSDLAERLGISASYLNLIEHNRRKLSVPVLLAAAQFFNMDAGELAGGNEAQLSAQLLEAFADDVFADADVTNLDVRDLAHNNPTAARAVLALYDQFRRAVASQGSGQPGAAAFHQATEAISDFLQSSANHFPSLEDAAERVRREIEAMGERFDTGMSVYLANVFGVDVQLRTLPPGVILQLDQARGELHLSDLAPAETIRFGVAQQLGLLSAAREIEAILSDATLPGSDGPALGRNVLSAYFAAALVMPYDAFWHACREHRYDIERLSRRFGASFEQVCHRMTTLQRKGATGIPFHLVRTDIAGNISKRFSLSGIHLPRHFGACPRWNIYAAFLSPGRLNVQVSEMTDGSRYFCVARTVSRGAGGYNAPVRHVAIGIGCAIAHAKDMVYAEGLDLRSASQVIPVGVSCQICSRADCTHRAYPAANQSFSFDPKTRTESIYSRPPAPEPGRRQQGAKPAYQ